MADEKTSPDAVRLNHEGLLYTGEILCPHKLLAVLLLVSLALPFVNLGMPQLGSVHEARVAATARTMSETGEVVVPYFNGNPRLQKTPLPYWTLYVLGRFIGPLDESTFRLPSAVMGVIGILLTVSMGRMLFGGWAPALLAGLVQALTVKYVIESRVAEVDIYLGFWVMVGFWLLTLIFFGGRRRDWLWPVFWAAVGLGFLVKWVVVFIFAVPAVVFALVAFPERRGKWYWHLVGLAVLIALCGVWPLLLVRQLGWDTLVAAWKVEVGENVTSAYHRSQHGYFYYWPQLFVLTFPWSAWAPIALSTFIWPEFKSERRRHLWLAVTSVVAILVLSFVSKKKASYLLPIVPLMALLAGRGWDLLAAVLATRRNDARTKSFVVWGIAQGILFLVAGVVCLSYCFLDPMQNYVLTILCSVSLGAAGFIALRAIHHRRGYPAAVAMFLGACIFGVVLFAGILPTYNARLSAQAFGQQLAEAVGDAPLVYYRGRDATLVYHAHRAIGRVNQVEELRELVTAQPDTFVLVQGRFLDDLLPVRERIVLHHPRFRDESLPLPGKEDKAFDLYLLGPGPQTEPPRQFAVYETPRPEWLSTKNLWLAFGFVAQATFFGRFLLQWAASEKKKQSVIPVGFWWLSLFGGFGLLIYAVFYLNDPVIMLGQSTGVLVYVRNLFFIYAKPKPQAEAVLPDAPQQRTHAAPPESPDHERPAPPERTED